MVKEATSSFSDSRGSRRGQSIASWGAFESTVVSYEHWTVATEEGDSIVRVLILGATGMLGHVLTEVLAETCETWATVRQSTVSEERSDHVHLLAGVQAESLSSVAQAIARCRPEAVINCIGLIKQLKTSRADLIEINALFPQRLKVLTRCAGSRLIHLSTDCVFSGQRGNYAEDDTPDANDDYGRCKFLGEVDGPGCLTLRTSVIGLELTRKVGLIEWFRSNRGRSVKGFKKAIYSGFTTWELSRILQLVLSDFADLQGVWHVASSPISKFDLLERYNALAGLGIGLEADEAFFCDRSLNGRRFQAATGYCAPDWEKMLTELANAPF